MTIEPPEAWAPARLVCVQLERLGYTVREWLVNGEPVYVLG